ncbi:MAG: hypothetical protein M3P84_05550, partial [Chloroflexota bacterium]|nr:hypothetical protein [Chloroflexota bacterium]
MTMADARPTAGPEPEHEPEPNLGLSVPPVASGGGRRVEVAVDAPGAGGRRYTYDVPDRLADLEDGEAVLVEFGRRQALGVVLGPAEAAAGIVTKPIVDRIRSDGPLLPPLTLALAGRIATTYLAPPAVVIRAMLPPGILERLELVAERRPDRAAESDGAGTEGAGTDGAGTDGAGTDGAGTDGARVDGADRALLDQLAGGPLPVRDLAAPEGKAGLLRRLRGLAGRGLIELDWTLLAASGGPRYERWIASTGAGRAVVATLRSGGRPAGRPLGTRQVALLEDLDGAGDSGLPSGVLTGRHGTAAVAGLVRRGLVAADVRERPRLPLGARPAGVRGGRPPSSELTAPQAEAVDLIRTALDRRDPTPLLLDGVTGGGKTSVYVEAIAVCLA